MIQRHTIQCALVLEAVDSLRDHATAEEVYEAVAKEHPHIGRGTVYRNLQKLAEAGEIMKVEVPGGADRYDHLTYTLAARTGTTISPTSTTTSSAQSAGASSMWTCPTTASSRRKSQTSTGFSSRGTPSCLRASARIVRRRAEEQLKIYG